MFLLRFISYLLFNKSGKTEEWEEKYAFLCDHTDYLFLRAQELQSSKQNIFFLGIYCLLLWWVTFNPYLPLSSFLIFAIGFTIVYICYFLSIYTYIPMEIEITEIGHRTSLTRRPSSVVQKKFRLREAELVHKYYQYKTTNNKTCIDMTDRILGEDQAYELGETVICFSGPNSDTYYVLPILNEEP